MKFKIALLPLAIGTCVNANEIERIEVNPLTKQYSPVNTLQMSKTELTGELLQQQKAPTLGDTLSQISGVSSSYFGASAGRPQIRGLGGQRVMISSNGLPVRDMSSVSDDQLVPIEPFFADRITVLKGAAATVAYGGEAMAGLVDVDDGRIPLQHSAHNYTDQIEIQSGYNTGTALLGRFQGQEQGFAYNVNLLHRARGDFKVPKNAKDPACNDWSELVLSSQLQAQCQVVLGQPQWEYNGTKYVDVTPLDQQIIEHRSDNLQGKVENSSNYQTSFTFGGSQVFANEQLLGFSFGYTRANRGIPGFMHLTSKGTDQLAETGEIRINSDQYRFDALYSKEFKDNSFLNHGEITARYTNQLDDESLAERFVNTFELSNWQLNPTLNYQFSSELTGMIGLALEGSKHQGGGVDNYLPDINSDRRAAYILQNANYGPLSAQLGARYEKVEYEPSFPATYEPGRGQGSAIADREFNLHNYVASMRFDILTGWWVSSSYTHAERAPAINELYANNPHFALLIEEQGNAQLEMEVNKATEFGTGISFADFSITANWYENQYENFIYLGNTGVNRGGVFVKEWRQADTENTGFEVELSYTLATKTAGDFTFSAFADATENTPEYQFDGTYDPFTIENFFDPKPDQEAEYYRRNLEGDSMPRTPADSQGLAVHWQYDQLSASLDYVHHGAQDKVAKGEFASQQYHLLGAYFSVTQNLLGYESEVYINIDNLTDEDARPHQSFLRQLTPLPGRSVALGIRAKI